MTGMDSTAERVNVYRLPGETDGQLWARLKVRYSSDYGVKIPLFKLLHKLGLKSTRWLLATTPVQ